MTFGGGVGEIGSGSLAGVVGAEGVDDGWTLAGDGDVTELNDDANPCRVGGVELILIGEVVVVAAFVAAAACDGVGGFDKSVEGVAVGAGGGVDFNGGAAMEPSAGRPLSSDQREPEV